MSTNKTTLCDFSTPSLTAGEIATKQPKVGDLRVWHINVEQRATFYVYVPDIKMAAAILNVLWTYDNFQVETECKYDNSTASGVQVYIGEDDDIPEDIKKVMSSIDHGWIEWRDDNTGLELTEAMREEDFFIDEMAMDVTNA